MRAKISTSGFRSWGMVDGVCDSDASWYDKAVLGDKAQREARAILAETEPTWPDGEAEGPMGWPEPGECYCNPKRGLPHDRREHSSLFGTDEGFALVTSLRRFIEAE